MNNVIKLEEAAMFALGIYLFGVLPFAWWWFPALILAPDVSFVGYAFGNKIGAWMYNIAHHKGLAITVYLTGCYIQLPSLQLAGIILFSHSCMDRLFGYGLKFERGFKFTHLEEIGKAM